MRERTHSGLASAVSILPLEGRRGRDSGASSWALGEAWPPPDLGSRLLLPALGSFHIDDYFKIKTILLIWPNLSINDIPGPSQVLIFASDPPLPHSAWDVCGHRASGSERRHTSSDLGRAPESPLELGRVQLTSGGGLFILVRILLGACVRCHPRTPGPRSQRPEPDLLDVWGQWMLPGTRAVGWHCPLVSNSSTSSPTASPQGPQPHTGLPS